MRPGSLIFAAGTAAAAEGGTRLNAFDNALLATGIGNVNLVKLSSIMPPAIRIVPLPGIRPGALVPAAYAAISSDVPGETIAAAIGWALPEDREAAGVIMEVHDKIPAKDAERTIERMLDEAFQVRGSPACSPWVAHVPRRVAAVVPSRCRPTREGGFDAHSRGATPRRARLAAFTTRGINDAYPRRTKMLTGSRVASNPHNKETGMQPRRLRLSDPLTVLVGIAAILAAVGCARMSDDMSDAKAKMAEAGRAAAITLSGAQEVPPVSTQATGTSSIVVTGDKNISGNIEVKGFNGTAAHVHEGAPGQNGPVIITLVKSGDNSWSVPANTILTSQQFDAYQRGNLYVNVHSAANPNGELRAQLGR